MKTVEKQSEAVKLLLVLPADLKDEIRSISLNEDRTMSGVIRTAIKEYLAKRR